MNPTEAVLVALQKEPTTTVAVAFSGGVDSAVLLYSAVEAIGRDRVVALHVDHGLREDSADDAAFARATAAKLGVRCRVSRVELGVGNVQSNARRARYAAIGRAAKAFCADIVLTAHHADDATESALERMSRGCGLSAVTGLRPEAEIVGIRVLRPFLELSRDDLARRAQSAGIEWREDPTNARTDYRRNAIRHDVIPRLTEERGLLPLRRTVQNLRDEADIIEGAVANLVQAAIVDVGTRRSVRLQRSWLAAADPAMVRLALMRAVERLEVRLERAHLEMLESLGEPEGVSWLDLPGGGVAVSRNFMTFHSAPTPLETAPMVTIRLAEEPQGALPWFDHVVTWGTIDGESHLRLPEDASVTIGGPSPGACVVFGNRRHKVTELLREAGVPVEDRWRWPCVYHEGDCIAVIGRRLTDERRGDADFSITAGKRARPGMRR